MTGRLLPFEERFRNWVTARGVEWRSTFLPCAGGDTTHALRLTPNGPPRRTVIALHGAGNDALFAWVGLFKELLLDGTEILTFDLPGHGRTGRTSFDLPALRTAVHGALEECRGSAETIPLHAIGVSLGGSALLHVLPDIQARLRSAVVVVAPLRIMLSLRSALGEIRPRTIRLLWSERGDYGLTGLIPSFGPFKRGVYPLRLAGAVPPGAFGYVEALNDALARMDLESSAARIGIPVLLVYGEHDAIVPPSQGARLARDIEQSVLLEVPGGTHLSTPLERQVGARIIRWLSEHDT